MKSEGVSWYRHGVAPVAVSFPEGDVCCEWCRCFVRDFSNSRRYLCFATGEMIVNSAGRGLHCPLALEIDEEEGGEKGD